MGIGGPVESALSIVLLRLASARQHSHQKVLRQFSGIDLSQPIFSTRMGLRRCSSNRLAIKLGLL
jgi:hypothetical protein